MFELEEHCMGQGKTITDVYCANVIEKLCNIVKKNAEEGCDNKLLDRENKPASAFHCHSWPLSVTETLNCQACLPC